MDWLFAILDASWTMFVLAAPYILFGLAFAGLIHVLLPESLVVRWMGTPGLSGVVRAALIGVPLPVCSCGVVPITLELRRKGASRPASQSFLITTPESSIDSIFLTWGMMGPVMAIARPIAAFFTAVLGGILSIASARTVDELVADRPARPALDHDDESCHSHDHGPDHGHDHHGHDHHGHDHHDHDHSVAFAGSGRARLVLLRAFGFGRRPEPQSQLGAETGSSGPETGNETIAETADGRERAADSVEKGPAAAEAVDAEPGAEPAAESEEVGLWRDLLRPAARYGFGELLDDLAFWLVVGVGLAGVLTALLPDNLEALGLGSGLLPMIALLVIGIPLYMCASASTPIAAALMLK
ncbi:MAG: permease, partial [Holophagales bacterium]|nr:permease [Holophagales bacterium]